MNFLAVLKDAHRTIRFCHALAHTSDWPRQGDLTRTTVYLWRHVEGCCDLTGAEAEVAVVAAPHSTFSTAVAVTPMYCATSGYALKLNADRTTT